MCDTMVAVGPATQDGSTLFAKNSDREPDEVQNLEVHAGRAGAREESRELTHISVTEPSGERARTFVCRPFWMFGAEMGANRHGVAIGNEALFTREKPDRAGLTGMDMLRLALERSRSAAEARDVIIELLERHGQGGNCGYRLKANYMNGFIIADPAEAFVLETVKSWWAWKKVTDVWSISNAISLTDDFDECSPGLIENAVKRGWARSESDFNFRRCYSDRLITWGAAGDDRVSRSRQILSDKKGALTTADLMAALRDHGPDPDWTPESFRPATLCMHAGDKLFRRSQSTGSLVAKLLPGGNSFYATGAANPCMSPFFPVFSKHADLPAGYKPGGQNFDPHSHWWRAERRNRHALSRFRAAAALAAELMDKHERQMVAEVESAPGDLSQDKMDEWFDRSRAIGDEWENKLDSLLPERTGLLYRLYWRGYNRRNDVDFQ